MQVISRAEASKAGLIRYFTGKQCIRGHIAERTMGGDCLECLRLKWPAKSQRTAGVRSAHYEANKAAIDAASKRYRARDRVARPWKALLYRASERSAKKGIEFCLTDEWAHATWTGRCALTGIPFDLTQTGKSGPKPFSPSIDRIDSSVGYVPNNCRFILMCVNNFRGTLGDDQMLAVAAALCKT